MNKKRTSIKILNYITIVMLLFAVIIQTNHVTLKLLSKSTFEIEKIDMKEGKEKKGSGEEKDAFDQEKLELQMHQDSYRFFDDKRSLEIIRTSNMAIKTVLREIPIPPPDLS